MCLEELVCFRKESYVSEKGLVFLKNIVFLKNVCCASGKHLVLLNGVLCSWKKSCAAEKKCCAFRSSLSETFCVSEKACCVSPHGYVVFQHTCCGSKRT